MTSPVSRSIAMVIGIFLLANAAARVVAPTLEASIWLIDVRGVWSPLGTLVMAGAGAMLAAFGVLPRMGMGRRTLTMGVAALMGAVAMMDAVRALMLSGNGSVQLGSVFTVSMIVLVGAMVVGVGAARAARARRTPWGVPVALVTAAVCLAGFPFFQMAGFGLTDYRRAADAIVVFGARTYADGRPSDALSDRMRTAIELYRQGLAPCLILSGGPGDGTIHEAETMHRLAVESGIPESALILDRAGLSTRATVANSAAIARERGLASVLAVSHFYHLPRVKLMADRAGLKCFTVPSPQGRPLNRLAYFMAREAAACWVYYLRV